MKNKFLKAIAAICAICCAFACSVACGDKDGSSSDETSATENESRLPAIDQEKYLLGGCEVSSDYRWGEEPNVDNDFIAWAAGALGAKSQRIWMHHIDIFDRAEFSNELTFREDIVAAYHDAFKKLKDSGVERIVAMNHAFLYPYGVKNISADESMALEPHKDGEHYKQWIEMYYNAYKMLATEFPEVNYWECGNEFDWGHFMHANTTTQRDPLDPEIAGIIISDLCYAASKAVREVNLDNVVVFPGFTVFGTALTTLEAVYTAIETKQVPILEEYAVTDPDEYFDVLAWHPYTAGNLDTFRSLNNELHDIAVRHGDGDKRVWFTEFGMSGVDETPVAQYFTDTFSIIKTEMPWVETVFVFRYTTLYSGNINVQENNFGIFYSPNDPEQGGKPREAALAIVKAVYGENAPTDQLYEWYNDHKAE